MFLWGMDYLHFHSDKPECAGVWDRTCPKPSRDYKNRVDPGPQFAPPRWVLFTHGDSQQCSTWQWAPRCTQCPSPLPRNFSRDLWICPEHEVWSCSCPTRVSPEAQVRPCWWTNATAPIMWLGLFLAIPVSISTSSSGHIDHADALKINVCASPGYSSLGWPKLHSPLLKLNFIPLEAGGDFHLLHALGYTCINPVRAHRRQISAAFGSIADKPPHARDFFPWLNWLLPQTSNCVFAQQWCLLNCF